MGLLSLGLSHRRPALGRSGFTLIEVVIVTLVMAIMAKVALSSFSKSLQRSQVGAAARQLAQDIRHAANHAQNSSKQQTITFCIECPKYTLDGIPHPNNASLPYEVNTLTTHGTTINSATFAGGNVLTFNSTGLPVASGSIVLKAGSVTLTVWVTSGGRVTIT